MKMHGVNKRRQAAHRAWQGKVARGIRGHVWQRRAHRWERSNTVKLQQLHRRHVAKNPGMHHTEDWGGRRGRRADPGSPPQRALARSQRAPLPLSLAHFYFTSLPISLLLKLSARTDLTHSLKTLPLQLSFPVHCLQHGESEPQVRYSVSPWVGWATRRFQGEAQESYWLTQETPTVAQAWPNPLVWLGQYMGSCTLQTRQWILKETHPLSSPVHIVDFQARHHLRVLLG